MFVSTVLLSADLSMSKSFAPVFTCEVLFCWNAADDRYRPSNKQLSRFEVVDAVSDDKHRTRVNLSQFLEVT